MVRTSEPQVLVLATGGQDWILRRAGEQREAHLGAQPPGGLDIFSDGVYVCLILLFRYGTAGGQLTYGRVGVWSRSWLGLSTLARVAWERDPDRDLRGRSFRVSSLGTGVSSVAVPPSGGLARCPGIAVASLSLSLSLWSWGGLAGSRLRRLAGRLWRADTGASVGSCDLWRAHTDAPAGSSCARVRLARGAV